MSRRRDETMQERFGADAIHAEREPSPAAGLASRLFARIRLPLLVFVGVALASVGLGVAIGTNKGHTFTESAAWGLIIGGIVVLILALAPFIAGGSSPGYRTRETIDVQRGLMSDLRGTLLLATLGSALLLLGLLLDAFA